MTTRRASSTQAAPAADDRTYADAVVAVLAEHFDLSNTITREVITNAVVRQHQSPTASFEVIIDSPHAASWRLRPHREDPRRVRLGDFRLPPLRGERPADPRQIQVNDALDRIR